MQRPRVLVRLGLAVIGASLLLGGHTRGGLGVLAWGLIAIGIGSELLASAVHLRRRRSASRPPVSAE